ncbi:FecR domain-containing protein [Mucilaginibacter sp. PAMB04168]|uniref:FecR family protein n=1 Tax=Mucilaginibacter sp. PAMB04168 TaxID=3138567 RepID=UPI0031F70580
MPNRIKKPSKQALINYFNGNSLADEHKAIEVYLAMEADTAYVEQCLKDAMANTDADILPLSSEQQEQTWQKFDTLLSHQTAKLQPKHSRNWMAYAAAITVFMLSATFAFYFKQPPSLLQSAVVYQRIEAGYGKIDRITLPDSSRLSLFPGTVIDIPSDFNATNRKVFLTGRAYFEVAHNKQKPFYVITSKVTTRVLGTSFEVNAAKGASTASVLLRTGRVCVRSKKFKQLAILHPGQKVTFQEVTGNYTMERVQPDRLLNWIDGELAFDQTSFAQICKELEKWYNITISVQSKPLLNKKITADFKGQSLPQVLDILSATAGFKYKTGKNSIHIY